MEDPEPEMVHVDIVDTREGVTDSQSLSTLQQVDLTTTAKNLCDAMEGKMDLSYDDSKHYTLVLVISYAISSRGSSRDSGTHTHYIHTFAPEDNIKATVATCMSSFCQKHHLPCQPAIINLTSSTLPSSIKIRFFYKSYLHYPLDIEPGDQSGSDSDEESTQVGLSDLAYLRHGADKRGFLLKRSKRDANLWRKRYCVLTDKLYILNAKKLIPTGVVAQLSGSMKLHLDAGLLDFPFIIRLEGRGEDQSWLLRAGGLQDHGEWCDVLLSKITLARENEVIKLAEVMICDEEKRKVDRLHKALDNSVFSTLGGNDALTSLVLPLSSEGGNLNCNSSRVASTGSTTSSASSTPSGNGSSKSANDADSGSGRSHDSRDSGREKERKKSLLSLSTTPIFSIRANINASTVVAATPTTSMDMVGKMQKEYNSSGAISQLTPTTSTIMSNKNQTPENSSILTQELHSNGPGESNQSHFNTEPINEQTSSRMEHLSKLLPRTEPSSEPLPKQRSHRRPLILHALLSQQDRDVWRAYCFIHDVSIYKEFFRMEVSVSDARIWREVCFVYDKHLAEYETVCLSSNDGKNAHRWKFSEASLQKVRSYMFKRIRPKTSQELHYQTLQMSMQKGNNRSTDTNTESAARGIHNKFMDTHRREKTPQSTVGPLDRLGLTGRGFWPWSSGSSTLEGPVIDEEERGMYGTRYEMIAQKRDSFSAQLNKADYDGQQDVNAIFVPSGGDGNGRPAASLFDNLIREVELGMSEDPIIRESLLRVCGTNSSADIGDDDSTSNSSSARSKRIISTSDQVFDKE